MSTQNGCSLAIFLIETESRNTYQILNKTWLWWQTMAPHPIPLPYALAFPPSSHIDATTPSPCWGPSFYDPRTHHDVGSHPEQAAPLSRRDNERRHTIGSHSALALRLYLAAYNPSSSCCFWVLDHLSSHLSQSFHVCWITAVSKNSWSQGWPFLA